MNRKEEYHALLSEESADWQYKQPCTVDFLTVSQRRRNPCYNGCQQKEKVQQIIE